jgi:hypothetical protein
LLVVKGRRLADAERTAGKENGETYRVVSQEENIVDPDL